MESEQHLKLPDMSEWDQAQFYFPTYENDTLLCLLEADGASDQGQDQVQGQVITTLFSIEDYTH